MDGISPAPSRGKQPRRHWREIARELQTAPDGDVLRLIEELNDALDQQELSED